MEKWISHEVDPQQATGVEWMAWIGNNLLGVLIVLWHVVDTAHDFTSIYRNMFNGRKRILVVARMRGGLGRLLIELTSLSLLLSLWKQRSLLKNCPTRRIGWGITFITITLNVESVLDVSDRARLRDSKSWRTREEDRGNG